MCVIELYVIVRVSCYVSVICDIGIEQWPSVSVCRRVVYRIMLECGLTCCTGVVIGSDLVIVRRNKVILKCPCIVYV